MYCSLVPRPFRAYEGLGTRLGILLLFKAACRKSTVGCYAWNGGTLYHFGNLLLIQTERLRPLLREVNDTGLF